MKKRSKVILNIILFTKLQGKPSNDAVTNDFKKEKSVIMVKIIKNSVLLALDA
jgi:hypothetical protein